MALCMIVSLKLHKNDMTSVHYSSFQYTSSIHYVEVVSSKYDYNP